MHRATWRMAAGYLEHQSDMRRDTSSGEEWYPLCGRPIAISSR